MSRGAGTTQQLSSMVPLCLLPLLAVAPLAAAPPEAPRQVGSPQPVPVFTVRAGDGENTLEWLNPGAGQQTSVLFRTDDYPEGPEDPAATLLGSFSGPAGQPNRFDHGGLINGTTYYYATFVSNADGAPSVRRVSHGRPEGPGGSANWVFATGASALDTVSVLYNGPYFFAGNDQTLHSMSPGPVGGTWPPGWVPRVADVPAWPTGLRLGSTIFGESLNLLLAGSRDGHVHAFSGATGDKLWSSPKLGSVVHAAPSVMLRQFGRPWDLVLAATREAQGDSALYALNVADGSIAWKFDDGGGAAGIGVINEQPLIHNFENWVFFGSRRKPGGSSDTLYCLAFTETGAAKRWSVDVGDIDGTLILWNNVLYVGNNSGEVQAVDPASGTLLWLEPYRTGDGPVKGFVWPDFSSDRLYFSTTHHVHAIQDNGDSATPFWTSPVALPSPSPPLALSGHVFVGAGDGRIYRIDGTEPHPAPPASVLLGDPNVPKVIGSLSFDFAHQLLIAGSEQGMIYAVPTTLF